MGWICITPYRMELSAIANGKLIDKNRWKGSDHMALARNTPISNYNVSMNIGYYSDIFQDFTKVKESES